MIGIIIATHGDFGNSLLKSSEMIMGRQENVAILGLEYGDSVEVLTDELKDYIGKMNKGDGVLVLIDLFGGSPSNATLMNMWDANFKSITGLNMPMLLEAFSSRKSCSLDELADKCAEAGRLGIRELHKELSKSF